MAKQDLTKVNKHCMTDGTREYYRNQRGAWAPGHYDGRAFVWESTTKYAARKRTFTMPNGTTKTVRLTKYTYERFLKPASYSPIGKTGREYKRAYCECFRSLYWDGKELYKAVNVQLEDGTYINSLEVFYDYDLIWDRWPEVERDITLEEPEVFEEPTTVAEPTATETEATTDELNAARIALIEATTTEGDQLDLIQWFGYGDTTWQELAAPAA